MVTACTDNIINIIYKRQTDNFLQTNYSNGSQQNKKNSYTTSSEKRWIALSRAFFSPAFCLLFMHLTLPLQTLLLNHLPLVLALLQLLFCTRLASSVIRNYHGISLFVALLHHQVYKLPVQSFCLAHYKSILRTAEKEAQCNTTRVNTRSILRSQNKRQQRSNKVTQSINTAKEYFWHLMVNSLELSYENKI